MSLVQPSLLAEAWGYILTLMILFFLKSIVESTVQDRIATRDAATLDNYKEKYGISDDKIAAANGDKKGDKEKEYTRTVATA